MKELYISILNLSRKNGQDSRKIDINIIWKEQLRKITTLDNIELKINENGKPCIFDPSGWHHNISHSKKTAVYALGQKKMGIDLEAIKCSRNFKSIAKEYFHKDEMDYCNNAERFYHIWTRKEAWLKKQGLTVWDMKMVPNMLHSPCGVVSWLLKTSWLSYSLSLALDIVNWSEFPPLLIKVDPAYKIQRAQDFEISFLHEAVL